MPQVGRRLTLWKNRDNTYLQSPTYKRSEEILGGDKMRDDYVRGNGDVEGVEPSGSGASSFQKQSKRQQRRREKPGVGPLENDGVPYEWPQAGGHLGREGEGGEAGPAATGWTVSRVVHGRDP